MFKLLLVLICDGIYITGRKPDNLRKQRNFDEKSSSRTSSTISTADMQAIIDKLRGEGNRTSTRANYYHIWKMFNQFIIKLDEKPNTWEDRLVLFVGYLVNNKIAL